MLGGLYTVCISVSRTVLKFNGGGSGRLSWPDRRCDPALMLAIAPVRLGFMPNFVLGGLLLVSGADALHKWRSWNRGIDFRRRTMLSLLAIIVSRAMGLHRRILIVS